MTAPQTLITAFQLLITMEASTYNKPRIKLLSVLSFFMAQMDVVKHFTDSVCIFKLPVKIQTDTMWKEEKEIQSIFTSVHSLMD